MSSISIVCRKEYRCQRITQLSKSEVQFEDTKFWENVEQIELVNNLTGEKCDEPTHVRACWTENNLLFQFICHDKHIISHYTERDDPLYHEDVIEIFIDEETVGKRYIELEVSPHNVIFDAIITNDGRNTVLHTDLNWDIQGLCTKVVASNSQELTYYVLIPASNFKEPLIKGKKFHINFYRIDENVNGERTYQAWSPTGIVQFHMPNHFGVVTLD